MVIVLEYLKKFLHIKTYFKIVMPFNKFKHECSALKVNVEISVFGPCLDTPRGLTVIYLLPWYLVVHVCNVESLYLFYLLFKSQFVCTRR